MLSARLMDPHGAESALAASFLQDYVRSDEELQKVQQVYRLPVFLLIIKTAYLVYRHLCSQRTLWKALAAVLFADTMAW